MNWTVSIRGGHDDQVLVEPDRRGVVAPGPDGTGPSDPGAGVADTVEAVAEDFGALATQVYLRWAGAGTGNQVTAVGELGGTFYGNEAIGTDTDVRLGLNGRRFVHPRLAVEGGISGWRFRRSRLEDFNVDMVRLSGRVNWIPARTWGFSASGRFNWLNFVDRFLPPDTLRVGGDGNVVVTPLGSDHERDRQFDLAAGVLHRLGSTAFLALDVTHRWTDSNEDPVRYRGPSVVARFGKQITGRLEMTAYIGHTWRRFLEPYAVLTPEDEVALEDRRDRAWQFGFGLRRPLAPRVHFYADGFWMNQDSSIEDFAFDQARFSVGVGVDLATAGPFRLRMPTVDEAVSLTPRSTGHGVRFRFRGVSIDSVSVVGDFNAWDPGRHPLVRIEDDLWEVVVPVPPGVWRYAFVVDGDWLRPPEAPRYEDDGFGGENGVLDVQTTEDEGVTRSGEVRPTRVVTESPWLGVG